MSEEYYKEEDPDRGNRPLEGFDDHPDFIGYARRQNVPHDGPGQVP